MITVVDYGMGNLRSVVKAIEKYTVNVRVSSDPKSAETSDALIMPGDGAFGKAIENLRKLGWIQVLHDFIHNNGYFLGICLGFQLLFSSSREFGNNKGLNIIKGQVVRFQGKGIKVPHMGWNEVKIRKTSRFLNGIPEQSHFYFIHSYYPEISDNSCIIGESDYGITFPCIIGVNNLIATQFHPEKSHNAGLKIIENFVNAVCS